MPLMYCVLHIYIYVWYMRFSLGACTDQPKSAVSGNCRENLLSTKSSIFKTTVKQIFENLRRKMSHKVVREG